MAFYVAAAIAATPRCWHRVAEGCERAPRLDVDVAGIHAAGEEFSPGGLGVGNHALHSFCEPGGIWVIAVPSTMEPARAG